MTKICMPPWEAHGLERTGWIPMILSIDKVVVAHMKQIHGTLVFTGPTVAPGPRADA